MDKHIPKEIITDEGQVYELKRPLHKQVWFWVSIASWIISALLFLTLIGFFVLNTVLSTNGGNLSRLFDGNTSYNQNADYYEEHEVGESVLLEHALKLKVESIHKDPQRALADDATGRAVVVRVSMENKGMTPVTINPYYFSLYDHPGNVFVLDTSTFDQKGWGDKLEAGKKVSLDLVFDGEDSEDGRFHIIYADRIRWWQESQQTSSSEGKS